MVAERRPRRRLCGWLVLVLLFAQLATAAYACPHGAVAPSAQVAEAPMPDCDGHAPAALDPEQPQLCKAHCERGSQSVSAAPAVDLSAPPLLLVVLDWSMRAQLQASAQPASGRRFATALAGAPPPGSPPLFLSLLVLRN